MGKKNQPRIEAGIAKSPIVGGVHFMETSFEESEMATAKSVKKKVRNMAEKAFQSSVKVVADLIDTKKSMDWIHHVMEKMQELYQVGEP